MTEVPRRKLAKSPDRWVGGVCAGIAWYLAVPTWVVRLIFALATLASGVVPGVAVYVVLWIVLPPAWPRGGVV